MFCSTQLEIISAFNIKIPDKGDLPRTRGVVWISLVLFRVSKPLQNTNYVFVMVKELRNGQYHAIL